MKECTGETNEKEGEFDEMANSSRAAQRDYIFIRLPVLWAGGEYGEYECAWMHCVYYVHVCICTKYIYVCVYIEGANA